MIKVDLTIWNV